jgi:hypothetical protein
MINFPVITTQSDVTAVSSTSAQSGLTMLPQLFYVYMADCATFIKQGANPTATGADGSMMVSANTPVIIAGSEGAKLAIIHPTATGNASLTPVKA